MALLANNSLTNFSPFRYIGGATVNTMFNRGERFNSCGGYKDGQGKFCGNPSGYLGPISWRLPQKTGGISSYKRANGSAAQAASLIPALNGSSSMSGSGDITSAACGLIVTAIASILTSSTMSAALRGALNAAADLAGLGDLDGALGALAGLSSNPQGNSAIGTDTHGHGMMTSDIVVTGEVLNTANVGAAVWNALAALYEADGTMGALLATAGSGGLTPEQNTKLMDALTKKQFLALK